MGLWSLESWFESRPRNHSMHRHAAAKLTTEMQPAAAIVARLPTSVESYKPAHVYRSAFGPEFSNAVHLTATGTLQTRSGRALRSTKPFFQPALRHRANGPKIRQFRAGPFRWHKSHCLWS